MKELRLVPRAALVLLMWLVAGAAMAADLPDFTGIVARNAPAVVHVEAKYNGSNAPVQLPDSPNDQGQQQMPPGMPDIFRRFFGAPMVPPQDRGGTSLGSGFIIS
ncbi:MAG TPA: hypothetical protein VFN09_00255, partial [Rhodanobacteraceae bacterium]|nr:hypothetical protein [Rhodanobacteraceae bacterium]